MIAKNAQRNFTASIRLMKQAEASSVALPPIGDLRSPAELETRARIVRSVLNARSLFVNIHRRTEALNEALDRFHSRKRQIASDRPLTIGALTAWSKAR